MWSVVWSENITVHPILRILKWALCHVISIVSIFRCCVMKHHYVMSKISSVFHSQNPINPVSFSPYGTFLLTLLARIRTAAKLYHLNTSLYWQRCRVTSVFLQRIFHQDVAELSEPGLGRLETSSEPGGFWCLNRAVAHFPAWESFPLCF